MDTALRLHRALEEPRQLAADMAPAATALLVSFCGSPQFAGFDAMFPRSRPSSRVPLYNRFVTAITEDLDDHLAEYLKSAEGMFHIYADHTRELMMPTRRTAVLLALTAARSIGYPLAAPALPFLDAFDGYADLLDLANDPPAWALAADLAPDWDGSAAALAYTVHLASTAPPSAMPNSTPNSRALVGTSEAAQ
jgi:hypothetical protein